ncbi:MAG TPA: RluA family pseudouridine synthase [Pirellulales bacterium]|jgi:23S rRNA-/tRNA-specific pseudouridylate synthase
MRRTKPKTVAADQTFRVAAGEENQTLAAALRSWLPKSSWSQIKKFIESRRVNVDGNLCLDAGRRLPAGSVVKLLQQSAAALPSEDNVRVQYLDEHLIVVEKPSGITSNRHREELTWPKRRRQLQPTLDELLPQIIYKIEGRRGKKGVPVPVRAVHRLDRETSGLLVFARTHAAERHLAKQFRQHTTHRRYLAIVQGELTAQTIRSRLVRDRGDGRRGSTDNPNEGKEAVTHVRPIDFAPEVGAKAGIAKAEGGRRKAELKAEDKKQKADSLPLPRGEGRGEGATHQGRNANLKLSNAAARFTLVQCRLETGRTHQIRIHLSEQGHPVCGDKVYDARPAGKPKSDKTGALRLALHAAELGFVHPVSGQTLRFQTPMPPALADFWERLQHEK